MCEALKEIMKDEINAEVKDACDKLASEKDAEFANVLAEKDAEFANVLSEKDAAFASVIAEKDAEFANSLSEKDARIAELEAQIKALQNKEDY